MSKIGKKPVAIPEGVEARINDGRLEFKGDKGHLEVRLLPFIRTEIKDRSILFQPENNSKQARSNWGTIRALASNAIIGVTRGFEKTLEIEGVGYRAGLEGDTLVLNLGFSHPVKINSPTGIKISVSKNTIKISGVDKNLVGKTAATVRALRKVEPYKGKGIRYQGEVVRRKAGKKVASATK